jgi:hypothetical protein
MNWAIEQVLTWLPDAEAQQRALALAEFTRWTGLGMSGEVIWGYTPESHATAVDRDGPTFHCACAYSYSPCPHAIALLLLYGQHPTAFPLIDRPGHLNGWGTSQCLFGPAQLQYQLADPDHPARQLRQQRGAAALAIWLRSLVQAGLQHAPSAEFDSSNGVPPWYLRVMALLHADLPGLAAAVQALGDQCPPAPGQADHLLTALANVYRLAQDVQHRDQLPPALQAEVVMHAGLPFRYGATVRAQQLAVLDAWLVLAQDRSEPPAWDGWHERRTWLWGTTTGRYALVRELTYSSPPNREWLRPSGLYQAPLFFYSGPYPLRAVPATDWPLPLLQPALAPHGGTLAQLGPSFADARALVPWLEEIPVTLACVLPVPGPGTTMWLYEPTTQHRVLLRGPSVRAWQLLATGGGTPLTVFGEWNGEALLPLAHWLTSSPTP